LLRSSLRSILCVSTQRQCVTHCAPRGRGAQEAGAPACRFAPDRPCEGSIVAAEICDFPVVRRALVTTTGAVVNRFCHCPCPSLCLRQKTIRLRRTCGLHSLPGARSCRPSTSDSFTKTSSQTSSRLSTSVSSPHPRSFALSSFDSRVLLVRTLRSSLVPKVLPLLLRPRSSTQ
jgi:hypothetical protein